MSELNIFSKYEIESAYICNCCCHDILNPCHTDSWGECCMAAGYKWREEDGSINKELFEFALDSAKAYRAFRKQNKRGMTIEEQKNFDIKRNKEFLKLLPEKYWVKYDKT